MFGFEQFVRAAAHLRRSLFVRGFAQPQSDQSITFSRSMATGLL
jgi:hypothetical protein